MTCLSSRRRRLTPVYASLLLFCAAWPAAIRAEPAPVVVHISNFTFSPATVTVPAGTAVTWINDDDTPHTVVAQDHSFRSSALDAEDKFTTTFSKPGQVAYFCSLHPHMVGNVVVTAP